MLKKIGILAAIAALAIGVFAIAGEKSEGEKKVATTQDESPDMMKAERSAFEGTLVCLGCSLKKAEGARSECKVFGHTHALATADGKYISFLENKFSTDLVKGEKFHEKAISVDGMYYASANVMDVTTYTIDGKKSGWCDGCSAMDGCAYKAESSKKTD